MQNLGSTKVVSSTVDRPVTSLRLVCALFAAEYVLDFEHGHDVLFVYDKLNSSKPVQALQNAFPNAGAYYNPSMRCLVFPHSGTEMLDWLKNSKRIVMIPKGDVEGAPLVEPLLIPDDL